MERAGRIKALTSNQMANRVCEREDNIYDKRVIANILNMYMDECYKALMEGERVQISRVGTVIPEVKVREGNFNLPRCNKEGGNPPYTKLRMSRNVHLGEEMNRLLIKNIKNGIWGLLKLPFSKQQMNTLKKSGYIPADAEIKNGDDE